MAVLTREIMKSEQKKDPAAPLLGAHVLLAASAAKFGVVSRALENLGVTTAQVSAVATRALEAIGSRLSEASSTNPADAPVLRAGDPTRPSSTVNWQLTARVISTIGHPLLIVPLAAAVAMQTRGASPHSVLATTLSLAAVAIAVAVFSVRRARSGRWAHVDASMPPERRELNRLLLYLLPVAALLLWAAGMPTGVVAGVGLSAGIVLLAQLTRRWLKVSLHCAFAAFAATLVWPHGGLVTGFGALAVLVAWSRLYLVRHTPAEVAMGTMLGALAGVLLQ